MKRHHFIGRDKVRSFSADCQSADNYRFGLCREVVLADFYTSTIEVDFSVDGVKASGC